MMYDVAQRQLAARTEQLSHVVQRLLAANHALEDELRRRTDNELQLRQKLETLQRALDSEKMPADLRAQFITLASHEFRTPFSTILSSATLARQYAEAGDAEKRDRHLSKIRSSVLHLTEILHDFLSASQLDENKAQPRPTHFDLCGLATEVIEAVKLAERADLEIIWQSRPPRLDVFSDRNFLEEILQNLLTNAARFSKREVIFRLFLEEKIEGENVVVEVEDFGKGIPAAGQRHIFERFFRASNVGDLPGVGLGLHISRRYAELLGGALSFVSSENLGTTFRLRFPVGI